ncbi:class I SAM-dependent methyltransferase [Mucilaginibacter sp. 14171R-50]|uniref:class I SAM-dependent methyltransferase n=1 Tax=Mucilaginibacter sp. 14171R-50 TaxID=2703789 RepID=UPI00138B6C48|nr:class I SAM-dependent methyltransferase [Mucilaginibacter sp. 14171R-50]QHS55574.1 class I SAM-dependent methyltransferase [Mucilaginibacter sp. 14171R-50]
MSTFSSLIKVLTHPSHLRALLSFDKKGYLNDIGWFKAFDTRSPVDNDGNPIPWVTYSFIDFIKTRLNKDHMVFEFGSGNSTYFYAKYAGSVVSVEHDKEWFDKIDRSGNKPANAELIYSELIKGGDYCRMPVKLNKKFDIIIVDGRDRVNCCKQGVEALSPNGVMVLDDSERDVYQEGIDFLISKGFKHLLLSGISPGLFYRKSTSVFYKADNCLDI